MKRLLALLIPLLLLPVLPAQADGTPQPTSSADPAEPKERITTVDARRVSQFPRHGSSQTFGETDWSARLQAGTDVGGMTWRSALEFRLPAWQERPIKKVTMWMYQEFSPNMECFLDSFGPPVGVWHIGEFDDSISWSRQPEWTTRVGLDTKAVGNKRCEDQGYEERQVSIDITDLAKHLQEKNDNSLNLGLRSTNENDGRGFRRYASIPHLVIEWDQGSERPDVPQIEFGNSSEDGTHYVVENEPAHAYDAKHQQDEDLTLHLEVTAADGTVRHFTSERIAPHFGPMIDFSLDRGKYSYQAWLTRGADQSLVSERTPSREFVAVPRLATPEVPSMEVDAWRFTLKVKAPGADYIRVEGTDTVFDAWVSLDDNGEASVSGYAQDPGEHELTLTADGLGGPSEPLTTTVTTTEGMPGYVDVALFPLDGNLRAASQPYGSEGGPTAGPRAILVGPRPQWTTRENPWGEPSKALRLDSASAYTAPSLVGRGKSPMSADAQIGSTQTNHRGTCVFHSIEDSSTEQAVAGVGLRNGRLAAYQVTQTGVVEWIELQGWDGQPSDPSDAQVYIAYERDRVEVSGDVSQAWFSDNVHKSDAPLGIRIGRVDLAGKRVPACEGWIAALDVDRMVHQDVDLSPVPAPEPPTDSEWQFGRCTTSWETPPNHMVMSEAPDWSSEPTEWGDESVAIVLRDTSHGRSSLPVAAGAHWSIQMSVHAAAAEPTTCSIAGWESVARDDEGPVDVAVGFHNGVMAVATTDRQGGVVWHDSDVSSMTTGLEVETNYGSTSLRVDDAPALQYASRQKMNGHLQLGTMQIGSTKLPACRADVSYLRTRKPWHPRS